MFVPRFDKLDVGNIYKYYIAYEMALERNKKSMRSDRHRDWKDPCDNEIADLRDGAEILRML